MRTIKDVAPAEVGEIRKAVQRVGTGPAQITGLSRRFNIVESDMSCLVQALTTTPPKPKAITETVTETTPTAAPADGLTAKELFDRRRAEIMIEGANRAQADIQHASTQDLEAAFALAWGGH